MSTKTTPKVNREALRKLRIRMFGSGHEHGPTVDWTCTLTAKDLALYRGITSEIKKLASWQRRAISDIQDADKIRSNRACEFCLKSVPVIMVKPGLVSEHPSGDWVCADCDPKVAGPRIHMGLLEALVVPEQSA